MHLRASQRVVRVRYRSCPVHIRQACLQRLEGAKDSTHSKQYRIRASCQQERDVDRPSVVPIDRPRMLQVGTSSIRVDDANVYPKEISAYAVMSLRSRI